MLHEAVTLIASCFLYRYNTVFEFVIFILNRSGQKIFSFKLCQPAGELNFQHNVTALLKFLREMFSMSLTYIIVEFMELSILISRLHNYRGVGVVVISNEIYAPLVFSH